VVSRQLLTRGTSGAIPCTGVFFFSSRRRHTRLVSDWSSDVCSSDLLRLALAAEDMDRPILAPPGVPPERLAALRAAFHAAMTDQIGRGSCRGKGESSGVVVACKKKEDVERDRSEGSLSSVRQGRQVR